MSEAQSISNIAYQKALDITNKLNVINNFEKTLKHLGEDYIVTQGNPMPENIIQLISDKAKYHAVQAFLMENIKAKDAILDSLKKKVFVYEVPAPNMGELEHTTLLPEVGVEWAREQLTLDEVNEYLLKETEAAHIGQFIHNKSLLDGLRKELPNIKPLEWMEVEAGKKTPVVVNIHHTSEQLSALYEQFSAMHREAEQRVNFFKAKMHNLMTTENARIAEVNANEIARVSAINLEVRNAYTTAHAKWGDSYRAAQAEFEAKRNKETQEAASLKIKTAPQFQEMVDEILKTLKRD